MNPQPDPIPEKDDEELARVRAARHRISKRFGHDPYRLVAYYMERAAARGSAGARASDSDTIDRD
jgi:hypothetical protein